MGRDLQPGERPPTSKLLFRAVTALHPPRISTPIAWAIAIVSVAACAGLQHLVLPGPHLAPFVFFFVSVAVSAWIGGWPAGLLAVTLSVLVANHVFLGDHRGFALTSPAIRATALFAVSGTVVAMLCAAFRTAFLELQRTTAERAAALTALREAEEDLNRAQAVAEVGSWRLDVRRDELRWSDEIYRIFGLRQGTPMSYQSFLALVHPEDRELVDRSWAAALKGASYDLEHRILVGGEVRWVRERATLELAANGELLAGFGTTQDVTQRKLVEQSIREADRRKGEFIGVLSHELRNPLAALSNGVHILRLAEAGSSEAKSALCVIERQASQLCRLIDDLLDVTRISRGKVELRREPVELQALIVATVEDQRAAFERRGIGLAAMPGEAVWVDGDRPRLVQVLGNLLHNAMKFTPGGGQVRVAAEASAGRALLSVRDSGVGITAEQQRTIFDPFVQADATLERSQGGLGLGLALIKGLVELHGGEVRVQSDGRGHGTEVRIALPLAREAREPVCSCATKCATATRSCRVLLIEDNLDAALSLSMVLELRQHIVAVAHTGSDGIARAREFAPDVVLCDIGLPVMDGYQVAQALRSDPALRTIPLVALTGYASNQDIARAHEAGFDRHLAKPPDIEAITRILGELRPR